LEKHLIKGPSQAKRRLDAILRSQNDPSNQVLQALYEAAVDVERDLRSAGASNLQVRWAARFQNCTYTLLVQLRSIDTNTDGEIFPIALRRKFDPSQATGPDFGLTDVQQWLHGYWNVVLETLNELSRRRGAQERVSLKLLVEQLCKLWERETSFAVTAHGQIKDQPTGRAETQAGRFVTAAVEAMLPGQSWFDERAEFARSFRARSFLPEGRVHRARQILVIMRDFGNRAKKEPQSPKK
jgi:hypothetical protein